jgi:LuxR family transcriptional regulator, maltose regulon positive regulatory protein
MTDRRAVLLPEAARSDADLPPPIAEAKLAAPRLRANAVPRPRILDALDGVREAAVALVAAPPGYGKTTVVRTWCAQREAAVAWVTLDAGDNDPIRLWSYVATAVDRIRNGLGRGALQRLMLHGGSIEFAVDELMNALTTVDRELVVVLDDLHVVTDRECLSSIDYALARLPPSVRFVLVTRTDPALELAALRAGGSLIELRTDSSRSRRTKPVHCWSSAGISISERRTSRRSVSVPTGGRPHSFSPQSGCVVWTIRSGQCRSSAASTASWPST